MIRFKVDILRDNDYYPGGSIMPGRSFNSGDYRYGGAGGQEMDNEIYGSAGTSYTAEYWQYDSRLMRRWNTDPEPKAHESPYAAFANNPIWFTDPNGRDTIVNPNGEKMNAGDGYAASNDGAMLYGEGLQTKIWDPTALGTGGENNGNYVNYDPSQHGDIQNVNSASATLGASLNGADGAIFQGGILQNMKNEDGISQYEQSIINRALGDKRFGKEAFAFDMPEELIYFGGAPNTYAPMSVQAITFAASPVLSMGLFSKTWGMALTPETWAIGRNVIRARVEITAAGVMGVTFRVEGDLDLSTGGDKSLLYNGIVTPLNIMWQGMGGSEHLPTYGAWHKKYKKQ